MVRPKPQEPHALVVNQADGLLTAENFDRSTDRIFTPIEIVYKASAPHLSLHINHPHPVMEMSNGGQTLLAYPHHLDCCDYHNERIQHVLQTFASKSQ